MADRDAIRALLDDLHFDEANEAVDDDPALRAEVSERRTAAEDEARVLTARVSELSAEGRLVDLAGIAEDDRSRALLALLPGSDRRQAEMHLDEAARWKAFKQKTSVRHLAEARTALDRLDLGLARGLVNKVDGRFLTDEQLEERDQLLLDISARSMELESMEAAGRELIDESGDHDTSWWRRWFD
jgi:hypothetical protein